MKISVEKRIVSLFDEFVQEQSTHRPYALCTIAKIQQELGPEDRADLERVLADRNFTGVTIARRLNKVLGERAYGIKGNTVLRHRNGNCSCAR